MNIFDGFVTTKRLAATLGAGILASSLSGCLNFSTFVEEGHRTAGFWDVIPNDPPQPLHVIAEFQRHGKPFPELNEALLYQVDAVLKSSKVYVPTGEAPGVPTLKVVANDTYDNGNAAAKGAMTGLTLGYKGADVTDTLKFSLTFTDPSGADRVGTYDGILYSTVGKAPTPTAARVKSSDDAVQIAVQDAVLGFLWDMQQVSSAKQPVLFVPGTQ